MRRGVSIVASFAFAFAFARAAVAQVPPPELTETGVRQLMAHVDGGVDAELAWSDFRDLRSDLRRFYADRGWTLAWLAGGRATDAAWRLVDVLSAAASKGLDPTDYGGGTWEGRLAALERAGAREIELVRADVGLTASVLRYAADVSGGRIRPAPGTEVLGRIQRSPRAQPPRDLVGAVERSAGGDAGAALAALEPEVSGYRRALAALAALLPRVAAEERSALTAPDGGPIAPERYADRAALAARLRRLGDLQEGVDEEPTSADPACASPLAQALARFQVRHGLDPSGFVDEPTVRALAVPLARRAEQLALALERWRWGPRRFEDGSILVNVPEFRLRAAEDGQALEMRVVVGQAYRWGTPVLAADVTSVTFRPTWLVPFPIQREELVPRIAADRRFIQASDFEVLDASETPAPAQDSSALLAGLESGTLQLRQRAGPENALGLVKLSLSSTRWIYLHGTPAPELFSRSRRDFSHGCIRVEDPVALAEWVLRDEPGWSLQAIRRAMLGRRTLEVPLSHPMPIVVGYFTAVVAEDGTLRFVEDIYGQDAALASALQDERIRRRGPP